MSNEYLPNVGGNSVQVFTPKGIAAPITAAGNVTVTGYKAVVFDTDLTIYFDSASTHVYDYTAGKPIGINNEFSTIHVSGACHMMYM